MNVTFGSSRSSDSSFFPTLHRQCADGDADVELANQDHGVRSSAKVARTNSGVSEFRSERLVHRRRGCEQEGDEL